jgi:hypothetical protein
VATTCTVLPAHLEGTEYSVPYQLAKQEVDVRLAASTVEALFKGKRVASHRRLYGKGKYSTHKEHMPDSHRRYAEWSPSRIVSWGRSIGPNTAKVAETILAQKPHPEQGFRSCLGIFRLSKVCREPVLSCPILLDLQGGVTAPGPVDDSVDEASLLVHIHKDLLDEGANNPLLQRCLGLRILPDSWKLGG